MAIPNITEAMLHHLAFFDAASAPAILPELYFLITCKCNSELNDKTNLSYM